MTSDNTTAMKYKRAYERLLCAILEQSPKPIIDSLLFEYCACDCKFANNQEGNKTFEEYQKETLSQAIADSKNYFMHYQGGRGRPVLKKCPLGRKLSKGAFAENEEA